ncbi:MAG: GNAT family N-acetyltransferase [Promethearchaeota archaeon]
MIHFRPATQDDSEFLFQLKKQTLKEYITIIWGWDEEVQRNFHQKNFKPEKYCIIQEDGQDIGCFSVEEHPDKFFLNIIEIIPKYQNKRIGSSLIRDLINKGLQEKKNVELQVFKVNQKAFGLYKSLGFILKSETDTHYQMIYYSNKTLKE